MLYYTVLFFIQALYEVAFAKSKINSPYFIYSVAPRQLIPPDSSLSQLNACVLVVEECDEAPEPLKLLGEVTNGTFVPLCIEVLDSIYMLRYFSC